MLENQLLLKSSKKQKNKVAICHVIPFYPKLIDRRGHNKQNVGYYHYAHSYVRGNWHRGDLTSQWLLPRVAMILILLNG